MGSVDGRLHDVTTTWQQRQVRKKVPFVRDLPKGESNGSHPIISRHAFWEGPKDDCSFFMFLFFCGFALGVFDNNTSTYGGVMYASGTNDLDMTFTDCSFTNNTANQELVYFDYVYLVINPQNPIPVPPTWSEDFNGTGAANPKVWTYEVGYQRNNELHD